MNSQSILRKPLSKQWNTAWMLILVAAAALFSAPLLAQQTGGIAGQITNASDGSAVSGVVISATSPVLPGSRTSTSAANGDYKLPLLPPGLYTLTFTLSDESTRIRVTEVNLQQRSVVDLAVDFGADESMLEEVIVIGTSSLAVDTAGASISATVTSDVIEALPVGQEYRDLIKLIPGVQYSEDTIRGPSAGGSGQDNTYQFDGVDVSLPLFGTLSAEPSTHDIDQVSIIRGGAKAIGFNRSGGFTVNTISKSGTDEFHGSISYQVQTADMTDDRKENAFTTDFEEDRDWATASFSGPLWKERLYFYGSYYRPTIDRENGSNAYGDVGDFSSERDEYFGKLTFAVTDNLLIDASYRTSDRTEEGGGVSGTETATASDGGGAEQDIAIVEASWIINDNSNAYFKYTDFSLDTTGRPDNLLGFQIALGDRLDVNNLGMQGLYSVPTLRDGEPEYNLWAQGQIDQYGFVDESGVRQGGGRFGVATTINLQDFTRESFEFGYDLTLEGDHVSQDLHIGYHQEEITETLQRTSNGWGSISAIGGRSTADDGTPIFYQARVQQTSLAAASGFTVPAIVSETKSRNIELNDTIHWNDFHFNIGVLISEDKLFGQGLKKNSSNVSGFEVALGNRYMMKKISFSDMIQPRLGVSWDMNDQTTVFANYALYHPSASSLARAASWARNLGRLQVDVQFDEQGNYIAANPRGSSSGKIFQDGIDPRYVEEYLVGVSYEVNDQLTTRAHIRFRNGGDFWEDTNNNARSRFEPPAGIPTEDYIPNLAEIRAEIGGSSYVIAQLDNAHTRYYELNLEAEWRGDRYYLQGSYVYSDYHGNFDQDNATTENDANTFIGSSLLADGAGRQLWDNKHGTLRGDRPHQFKIYGYYELNWNANVGAYFVYQSGQPWEAWDVETYRHLTGSSSDTIRYAEAAGSRRTSSHYQLDLNYTQNFYFGSGDRYTVQLRADLFNAFDNQTGYNIQSKVNSAGFGDPRRFYNPRRLQLLARFLF